MKCKDFIHDTIDGNSGDEDVECKERNNMIIIRVIECIMTQFSLNKEFNVFGQEEENVTRKELEQLHMHKAFKPIDGSKLTQFEKSKAMSSLMFLTE